MKPLSAVSEISQVPHPVLRPFFRSVQIQCSVEIEFWLFGLRTLRTNEQSQATHLIFDVNATVSMDQFARAPSSRRRAISVCTDGEK